MMLFIDVDVESCLIFPCPSVSLMLIAGQSSRWERFPLEVWRPYFRHQKKCLKNIMHYCFVFFLNI